MEAQHGAALREGEGVRMTKQGLRDLGGGRAKRRIESTCGHVWEWTWTWDCFLDVRVQARRCGFCQAFESLGVER